MNLKTLKSPLKLVPNTSVVAKSGGKMNPDLDYHQDQMLHHMDRLNTHKGAMNTIPEHSDYHKAMMDKHTAALIHHTSKCKECMGK